HREPSLNRSAIPRSRSFRTCARSSPRSPRRASAVPGCPVLGALLPGTRSVSPSITSNHNISVHWAASDCGDPLWVIGPFCYHSALAGRSGHGATGRGDVRRGRTGFLRVEPAVRF
ncbi:hypothetical protein M885DRAFT_625857, partial [Pelagophyceae sp. CCMP2097]